MISGYADEGNVNFIYSHARTKIKTEALSYFSRCRRVFIGET